jgi:hypothetical protein
MILDERLEFCDATALNTGGAASYLIGDVVDISATSGDIGVGQPLYFVVQVDTTATSGGSATGTFSLCTDGALSSTDLAGANVLVSSKAWTVATMTAGTVLLAVQVPAQGTTFERYLQVQQTTGTAAFTAGKINAFLTTDPSFWRAYADNTAIA